MVLKQKSHHVARIPPPSLPGFPLVSQALVSGFCLALPRLSTLSFSPDSSASTVLFSTVLNL